VVSGDTKMKLHIKKRLNLMKEGLYGESLLTIPVIIDRNKYKGRGRPKNTDYITVQQAQKIINDNHNIFLKGMAFYDASKK
jgi:hypothetical protein